MIDGILALLTGGATGLLGTVISVGADWLQARQRHGHAMELRRLDIELHRAEAAAAERTAAIEAESAETQAEWAAMRASYAEAGRRWSRPGDGWAMIFVDLIRGLVRPALTIGSLALVGAIYFTLGDDPVAEIDIAPRIVDTALYISTTATLWWFGARGLRRTPIVAEPRP